MKVFKCWASAVWVRKGKLFIELRIGKLGWQLSPTMARDLAAQLIKEADSCDEIVRTHEPRGKPEPEPTPPSTESKEAE